MKRRSPGLVVVFAVLFVAAGISLLGFFALGRLEEFQVRNESFTMNHAKLSYFATVEQKNLRLEELLGTHEDLETVVAELSNEIVFAALIDPYSSIVETYGMVVPEGLPDSAFMDSLLFSFGEARSEMDYVEEQLYLFSGIILDDDSAFVIAYDFFKVFGDNIEALYSRTFWIYVGDERSFVGVDTPAVDPDALFRVFRGSVDAQRPRSIETAVNGMKYVLTVLPVYDADNWDIRGFFAMGVESSVFSAARGSFLIRFIAGSLVALMLFVMMMGSLAIKVGNYDRPGPGLKRLVLKRVLISVLPVILFVVWITFGEFDKPLEQMSEEVLESTSRNWYGSFSQFPEDTPRFIMDEFIRMSRVLTGSHYLIRRGESVERSTLASRVLAATEVPQAPQNADEEYGSVLIRKVKYSYASQNISDKNVLIMQEQTILDNHRLAMHFLSIGLISALAVLVVITSFFMSNLSSSLLVRRTLTGYGFLSPSLIHLVWWAVGPLAFSLFLAFRRWSIVDVAKPFVGFDNFRELFQDRNFWNAMKNTVVYSLFVPISMVISLLLAVAVNKVGKVAVFLRVLYYLPVVTAGVATTIVWRWMFNRDFGVLNYVLGFFGIPRIAWLDSPQFALISIMIIGIWSAIGGQMIIFLAGLQGIPAELYDAASVDGANKLHKFGRITVPLLKPTSLFVLVTSIIGSFQVFTPVYILTQGGPLRSTDVVFYHIWEAAWVELRMGYAAAQSWILFLFLAVLTYAQFKLFGKESWQAYF